MLYNAANPAPTGLTLDPASETYSNGAVYTFWAFPADQVVLLQQFLTETF